MSKDGSLERNVRSTVVGIVPRSSECAFERTAIAQSLACSTKTALEYVGIETENVLGLQIDKGVCQLRLVPVMVSEDFESLTILGNHSASIVPDKRVKATSR